MYLKTGETTTKDAEGILVSCTVMKGCINVSSLASSLF